MKKLFAILKIVILSLIGMVLLGLFWAFLVPGMMLWWILRERYQEWVGVATALGILLIWRFFAGEWNARADGQSSGDLGMELALGAVSWAIGSILVSAGYRIPKYFLEGLRTDEEVDG